MTQEIITKLIEKGVCIPNPETVYISPDVDIKRISGKGVTLFAGTKLVGSRTLIMAGCRIGYEGPVTLENSLVGPDSSLNGGYFQDTVFMGRNVFGANGHVRKGTILEEEANAAHTVGLKQTILFPFVTLGSLINFCDCFMAGGTSRKDHSEVGSSFIHFNYTPNQDKATPSMMGNVTQGVMLDQPPVFLGGQGGLVGPVRIGFGSITAAGSIVRNSEERPGRLIMGGAMKNASLPWRAGGYNRPDRVFDFNIAYIAGLYALKAWYTHIRPLFIHDEFSRALIKGLGENLDTCIQERVKRLDGFGEKLKLSPGFLEKKGKAGLEAHTRVLDKLAVAEEVFGRAGECLMPTAQGEAFIQSVEREIIKSGKSYIQVIQGLAPEMKCKGTAWLAGIEEKISAQLKINQD